ncbi:MAG: Maf family protein [Thiotrichales bacterium]
MTGQQRIILASRSPRRVELLQQIGISAEVVPADIDESLAPGESPEHYVERMAREKAQAIAARLEDAIVIGADTTVVCAGGIFGKPADLTAARDMLHQLSGRTHNVLSAVAVWSDEGLDARVCTTAVTFRKLSDQEILEYWESGEPAGKAGAYAIQGRGARFIERIEGSYSGVMGLPLFETAALLEAVNSIR